MTKRPGARDKATGEWDERIDKYRVIMRSATITPTGVFTQEATDYVRADVLDAYLVDARTRWQDVTVSEDPDAGPSGYHGQTHVPDSLSHPLRGQTFAATKPEKKP
jgi:uncharacterized phage protein gp47/JayE